MSLMNIWQETILKFNSFDQWKTNMAKVHNALMNFLAENNFKSGRNAYMHL